MLLKYCETKINKLINLSLELRAHDAQVEPMEEISLSHALEVEKEEN